MANFISKGCVVNFDLPPSRKKELLKIVREAPDMKTAQALLQDEQEEIISDLKEFYKDYLKLPFPVSTEVSYEEKTHKGVKFRYVTGELKTKSGASVLAYTTTYTDTDGKVKPVVYIRGDLTTKEMLDHITGATERINPTGNVTAVQVSKQKELVSSFMLTFGIDLPALVKKLSDKKALGLVIRHELSHIERNHRDGYLDYTKQILAGKKANTDNKYLNDRAIIRESQANLDALKDGGLITKTQHTQGIAYTESLEAALTKPNRVIIAGSRAFTKKLEEEIRSKFAAYMDGKDPSTVVVISGTAKGADTFGETLAKEYGVAVHRMPAQEAGHIHNANMATIGTDLIVGWDGKSAGTKGMLKQPGLTLIPAPNTGPVAFEPSTVKVAEIAPEIPKTNFLITAIKEGFSRLTANNTSGTQFQDKDINSFIKVTDSRKGIFNIPIEVFDNPDSLAAALVSLGLSEDVAIAAVIRYQHINNVYTKLLTKPVVTAFGVDTLRIPLELLKVVNADDGNAALPPHVILAASMGFDHWVNQNYSSRPFANTQDAADFMYGSRRAKLDTYDQSIVWDLGLPHNNATEEIGRYIQQLLGMSATSTQAQAYMDALSGSMGTLALQLVSTNNTVPADQTTVAELTIVLKQFNFADTGPNGQHRPFSTLTTAEKKSITDAGRSFNHGNQWNSIKFVTDGRLDNRSIEDIRAADKASSEIMEILGANTSDENKGGILTTPSKTVSSIIRGSLGKVPAKMKAIMRDLQQVAWGVSETLSPVMAMYKSHPELMKERMGVVEFDEQFETAYRSEGLQASNEDKINDLERVIEANEIIDEDSGKSLLDTIYFKFRLMNQHRMMMQGIINPQNSHVTRYLLSPKGTTKYTKENIHLFKYAVMFSFGFSVDKRTDISISQTFDNYLSDPDIVKAAKLIGAEKLDNAALAKQIGIITKRYANTLGATDLSLFNGLTALSKYVAADTSKDNYSFESDVVMEIDGVSNGFSINVMQFPQFGSEEALEKHLNQVSVYIGKTPEDTTPLQSGIYNPNSSISQFYNGEAPVDAYEDLVINISKGNTLEHALDYYAEKGLDGVDTALSTIRETYEARNQAMGELMPLLKEVTRSLVKYPFMIFMYGGGINSIVKGVADQGIDQLYEEIGKLRKGYVTKAVNSESNITEFLNKLNLLGVKEGEINKLKSVLKGTGIGATERFQKFTFNNNNLSFLITEVIKPRFDYGLNSMLGNTSTIRKSVIQAGELMHAIFIQRFAIAKAEYLKANNRKTDFLTDEEIAEITLSEDMLKWLPKFIGPLTDELKGEFVDITKRSSRGNKNTPIKVSTVLARLNPKVDESNQRSVSTELSQKEFISPGVSALIRAIINLDAAMLATALKAMPELLPLYDAAMGRPELLVKFAEKYNEAFGQYGFSTNIAAQFNQRVRDLQQLAKEYDATNGTTILADADTWINDNSHNNQFTDEKIGLSEAANDLTSAATVNDQARRDLEKIRDNEGMSFDQMLMRDLSGENPDSNTAVDERLESVHVSTEAGREKALFDKLSLTSAAKEIVSRLIRAASATIVGNKFNTYDPSYIKEYTELFIEIEKEETSKPITKLAIKLGKLFGAFPDTLTGQQLIDAQLKEGLIAIENLILGTNRTYAAEIIEGKLNTDLTMESINSEIHTAFDEHLNTDISFSELSSVDQEIIDIVNEYMTPDPDTFGTLNNQRKENPTTVLETAIDSTNVRQLFDRFMKLGTHFHTGMDSAAYAASVEQILTAITRGVDHINNLNLEVEQVDGITQGEFSEQRNLVQVSLSRTLPGGRNAHSPQEVYLHEMVHALTVQSIKNGSVLTERIHTIRKSVKKAVDDAGGYKIFLTDTVANSSPIEIAFAKEQYVYLFADTAEKVPEEFLAYALTNPAMINFMLKHDRRFPDRGKGLRAELLRIWDFTVDAFMRFIGKRYSANSHAEIIAIAEGLIDLNSKHADVAHKYELKVIETLDKLDNKVVDFVIDKSKRLLKVTSGTPLATIPGAIIGGAALVLSENAAVQRAKLQVYSQMHSVANSLFKELGDGVLTPALINMLLYAQSRIGKLYYQVELDAVRRIEDSWKSTTEKEVGMRTRQAITRVLLRTDLSSLLSVDYNANQIQKLLGNPALIDKVINNLTKLSGINHNSDAIRYTKELGYHMTTKNTRLSNGHFNVHTIASKFLTPEQHTADNIKRLDAIATLSALKKVDSADRKIVADLMAKEIAADPNENAFTYMLETHRAQVADSLEGLFDNNPTQMVKGHTVERIDNMTDVKTGLGDPSTIRRMALAGYTSHYKLAEIEGVPKGHTTMYVSRYMPEIRHVSGILSTTGLHHKGTLATEMIARDPAFQKDDGSPDMKKISNKLNQIKRQEDAHAKNKTEHDSHNFRPIYDENGNITDYRVMMNIAKQEELFQPDIEFQNVFAHMKSSYISKKNTIQADKQAIDLLVDEWVRREPMEQDKFVNILDKGSKYFEYYKKLPTEIQKYLGQYVVKGEFLVREEILNKVFGYAALDFSKIPSIQAEVVAPIRWMLRNLNYGLRKVMTFGMERIVMATLKVIIHNIQSNFFQLSLFEKIPISYMAAKMEEGSRAHARYNEDNRKLRDALQDRSVAKSNGNIVQIAKSQKEIDALNEQIQQNPLHRISELGLDSIIVEDVNTASQEGFVQRIHKALQADKVTKFTKHMPTLVKDIAKNTVLTRDSGIYKKHKEVVQMTDFLSRYVLISYRTEVKGENFEEVFQEAVDAFVLFDENMHPAFEFINSMGFTAFLSYWLRVTRPVRKYIRKSPFTVGTSIAAQHITGIDTTAMLDGSIFGGKFLPNNFYMDELVEAATTIATPANLEDAVDVLL